VVFTLLRFAPSIAKPLGAGGASEKQASSHQHDNKAKEDMENH
jgi:hypothetical protein